MKTRSSRLMSVIIIFLIIFTPVSLAANNTTQTQDNSLFLDVALPDYTNSESLEIIGNTTAGSTAKLYVNEVFSAVYDVEEDGLFYFEADLNPDFTDLQVPNQIKIEVLGPQGEKTSAGFNVTVDETSPVIQIDSFPSYTSDDSITVTGTVSETSYVEIFVNNVSVYQQNTDSFSASATIREGENTVKITALDRAGNIAETQRKILLDTTPPRLENISPDSGSIFYESAAITDIEGDTEPNATVDLYIGKEPDGNPDFTEKANSNGRFRFEDVDLEQGVEFLGGYVRVGSGTQQPDTQSEPVTSEEITERDEGITEKQEETSVDIYIVATDSVGFSVQEDLSYTIATCFSGVFAWNIMNMVEYQSPSLLSGERLAEGTELIQFILELDYQGNGENPVIKSLDIDDACTSSIMQDPRYNYSCQALPSSPVFKKPNSDKTLWIVKYNLNQLGGLNNFSEDYKKLTQEMVFPLKLTVEYTHEIQGKEEREFQTSCEKVAYAVDTSMIDPRDVFSNFINDKNRETINRTIQNLNRIIDIVDKRVQDLGKLCLIAFGARVVTTIFRRAASWQDYLSDRAMSKDNEEKCPIPGPGKATSAGIGALNELIGPTEEEIEEMIRAAQRQKLEDIESAQMEEIEATGSVTAETEEDENKLKFTQDDLTNEQLEERCSSAYSAWQSEEEINNAYRWVCDRFLCRGSPAPWTATADSVEIRRRIEENTECTTETSTKGTILRKQDVNTCKEECDGSSLCWEYKGDYYKKSDQKPETKGDLVIEKCRGIKTETVEIVSGTDNVQLKEEKKSCEDVCDELGWQKGECKEEVDDLVESNTPHTLNTPANNCDSGKFCVCYSVRGEEGALIPPADSEDEWNYRYDKLGYFYDNYKYYEGRDQSACFGQPLYTSPDAPYLNPQDILPAFQCLCGTQILQRLKLARNILQGLYNCMSQIQKTGTYDTGVCKEFFSQYICKWLARIITQASEGCLPWTGTGKSLEIGDTIRAGTDSIFGGVQESTNDLLADYNSAALRDYIGIGEGAIAEKICLASINADWGWDLEGFMDAAYTVPYHTSAGALLADREYLAWDPDTELATYEYRIAWTITPGCDIDSYSVQLSCITDHELASYDGVKCIETGSDLAPGGCDCASYASAATPDLYNQDSPGPTYTVYTGGRLSQGVLEDKSEHVVVTQPYRFDNVKITINVNDPDEAEKCIPEENRINQRQGVFYSPIKDATVRDIFACRFDQSTGKFICDAGGLVWEKRGRAYFGSIKCEKDGQLVDCREKTFYLDEPLTIDYIPVYNQGESHCLYAELKNGYGTTIETAYDVFPPDPASPNRWVNYSRSIKLLDSISESYFYRELPIINIKESGSSANLIRSETELVPGADIEYDTYHSVYFKDTDNDNNGDQYRTETMNGWTEFTRNTEIELGGLSLRFDNPAAISTCNINGQTVQDCKEYELKYRGSSSGTSGRAWTLKLQLRHFPEQGFSCTDSIPQDVVTYQGLAQEIDPIYLNVKPEEKPEDDNKETEDGDGGEEPEEGDEDKDRDSEKEPEEPPSNISNIIRLEGGINSDIILRYNLKSTAHRQTPGWEAVLPEESTWHTTSWLADRIWYLGPEDDFLIKMNDLNYKEGLSRIRSFVVDQDTQQMNRNVKVFKNIEDAQKEENILGEYDGIKIAYIPGLVEGAEDFYIYVTNMESQ